MERTVLRKLYEWKDRPSHKPLILNGARQVGKTWLMQEFGRVAYDNCIYINFEDNNVLNKVFEEDFDVERVLTTISIVARQEVTSRTLLLFDEIQTAPRGLTALKYFYEKAPHLDVIAAGSLLGLSSSSTDSFPVGKVEFVNVYPMTFFEFLKAVGEGLLCEQIEKRDWSMVDAFSARINNLLKTYYFVGGMPEAVREYVESRNLDNVRRIQDNILMTYERDFSKHAPANEVPRIRMVWDSLVAQLSKENRKFVFGILRDGARAKDFELAIEWLRDAGLIYKVCRTKKGLLPLNAYEVRSAFKVFVLDLGLLGAKCRLSAQALIEGNRLFSDYRGALTEQYVLQQLKSLEVDMIYYWSADNSQGEIDFLVQNADKVIPIEVKAEENLRSRSLRVFVERNEGLHGLRFSMSGYREQDWMTNVPLYAVLTSMSVSNQ